MQTKEDDSQCQDRAEGGSHQTAESVGDTVAGKEADNYEETEEPFEHGRDAAQEDRREEGENNERGQLRLKDEGGEEDGVHAFV